MLRTVTLPALMPGIVSAATVVFLFCATAFGVVLTLGGLRYATVETEIYQLTTQFLDLRAASALSVLQLLVVTALLSLAQRTRSGRDQVLDRAAVRDTTRRPGRRDAVAVAVTVAVLVFVAAPRISASTNRNRRDCTGPAWCCRSASSPQRRCAGWRRSRAASGTATCA